VIIGDQPGERPGEHQQHCRNHRSQQPRPADQLARPRRERLPARLRS
jgi:hypothetical protein